MTFKNIFTEFIDTEIFKINLPKLKNHILKVREKSAGRQISNCGGWQSEVHLTPNSENKLLFNSIHKQVKKTKEKINFYKDLKLLSYWYNINYKGSFNIPHRHVGATDIISGVFYVQTFNECGNIVFRRNNPMLDMIYSNQIEKYNIYNSSIWTEIPKDNKSIIFSSYLEHMVLPNLKDKPRISIGFNYGT
jgi:uncharacterized protein (TIGR02466 family)|tara:strand:+ start:3160 stop:3732 length:573 start_codon:yes stop_codon:yes gene_type:complete